jgi:putative DNA primase/helicase
MTGLPGIAKQVGNELRVTSPTIFEKLLDMDMRSISKRETMRLAECMRVLGWSGPKNVRIDGEQGKGYVTEVGMAPDG